MLSELEHAVAQLRRSLKVEVCRRPSHLLLHLRDELTQLAEVHGLRILLERRLLLRDLLRDRDQIAHRLADRLRSDSVLLIVFHLHLAAALRLLDCLPHRVRDRIRVHDDVPVRVSRRASDRLHERGLRAQESFLVGVQDRHQRDLRNVQALSQQVDAHQHVKNVQPHIPDDLRPLQRVDIRVQVLDADACPRQVIREILRHLLGQSSDQHLVSVLDRLPDLADQVVDLPVDRPHIDLRVQKPRRPDDLLRPQKLVLALVRPRRRAHEKHLVDMFLKFPEIQRPVVQRRGQPEAVLHQRQLPRPVAVVHRADLRDRHVRLVDDDQEVLREEIHQRQRRIPRSAKIQMPRIILDPAAESRLAHHLHVKIRPLGNPLRLNELVLSLKVLDPLSHLSFNVVARHIDLLLRHDIVGSRPDHHMAQFCVHSSGQLFDFADPVDLLPEPLDPQKILASLRGIDLDRIASYPEIAALQ